MPKIGKENLNSDSQQFNSYQEKKNESVDMNIIIFGFPTLYKPQGNTDVRLQTEPSFSRCVVQLLLQCSPLGVGNKANINFNE